MTATLASRQFGPDSTTDEVLEGIDLSGKRVLITGVSAGLGVETARALAARGATVVGTARDLNKAREALAEIPGSQTVTLVACDLESLSSVRNATDTLAKGGAFDAIIANAGVMALPKKELTVDGFEKQLGINHLGHFVLINRLAQSLKKGSRVISLSSSAHLLADVDLADPNFTRKEYSPLDAYGQSKTAIALFAVEFDRRHRDRGVRAASLHPGIIRTELTRYMSDAELAALGGRVMSVRPVGAQQVSMKSVQQGAATSVWAAFVAASDEIGGRYCEDCHVVEPGDDVGRGFGVARYALDPERAKELWAKSEELVAERF